MRVAIITPTLDFSGGAEKQLLYLARNLQQLGNVVDIYSISFNRDKCHPDLNKDINVYSLIRDFSYPSWRSGILTPYEFLLKIYYCKKLVSLVNREYDVINCHNFPSTLTAVKVKEKFDIPLAWFSFEPLDVVMSKNPIFYPLKYYEKGIVKKIDGIVTYPYNRDAIERLYDRTPETLYPGVNVGLFEKGDGENIRKKYRIKGEILIFVGELIEHKRIQDLINALKIVKKARGNICLLVVGRGPYEQDLVNLARENNLEEDIIFVGTVKSEKELADYYASADIFLNPVARQTWGLVPFEAMAAGTPVIVSSATGAAKVIQANNIGMVLDPLQPEVWAKKIVELLENEEERMKISDVSHEWIKKNMCWEIFTKSMLKVFEQVVSK